MALEVAESKCDIRISKFKAANTIWRVGIWKNNWILRKMGIPISLLSLNPEMMKISKSKTTKRIVVKVSILNLLTLLNKKKIANSGTRVYHSNLYNTIFLMFIYLHTTLIFCVNIRHNICVIFQRIRFILNNLTRSDNRKSIKFNT